MKSDGLDVCRLCSRVLVPFVILIIVSQSGRAADAVITLKLNPNVYTTSAGGQITLRGSFTTPDAVTFTYNDDRLFGLSSTSPHLGIVGGLVLSSQDFSPPVSGTSFADVFGGGGYLGPALVNGPVVTGVADLRTFVIPAGTSPGTYRYSYGVDLLPTVGGGQTLFDTSLTIVVATGVVDLAGGILNPLFSGTPGNCPTSWICTGSPAPGFASYSPTIAQYPGGSPFPTGAFSPTVFGGSGTIRQNTSLTWVAGNTYVLNLWAGFPNTEPNGTTSVEAWAPTARLYLTTAGGAQVAAFDIPSPVRGTFASNPISFKLPSNSPFIGQKIGLLIFVSAPSLFSANFAITPVGGPTQ